MISEYQLTRCYCSGDFTEIENYAEALADTTQTWEIHHRLELTEDGEPQYSVEDLKEKGWYYDRPSDELIFLTPSEHKSLHHKGKKVSDSTREKMSKSKKGKKLKPFTAEHRENMSKSKKGVPKKHFDITVSYTDDPREYQRQYREKKKALNAKYRTLIPE